MQKLEIINDEVVNVVLVDPDSIPDWCVDWPTCDGDPDVTRGSKRIDGVWVHPSNRVDLVEPLARERRDEMLRDMDKTVSNPLRWADLTSEKQAEWQTYRQSLLDVPQQDGFPITVEWPTKPDE